MYIPHYFWIALSKNSPIKYQKTVTNLNGNDCILLTDVNEVISNII